jgi:hypothetical protein
MIKYQSIRLSILCPIKIVSDWNRIVDSYQVWISLAHHSIYYTVDFNEAQKPIRVIYHDNYLIKRQYPMGNAF